MTDYKEKYRNQFFKVAYFLMAISFVLTVGCATVSDKRYVENNTFISTYPKMAIKVSPELKYVGELHPDRFMQAPFDVDSMEVKAQRDLYIFCQKGNDDNVKRGVAILVNKLPKPHRWHSQPFTSEKSKKRKMDTGETKFGGMNWRYAIWRTRNFFGFAKDFLHEAGYLTTNPHLVFAIGRIITHEEDTVMFLFYIEDLREFRSEMQRFRWMPLVDRERFVNEFMDRAFKTVQFSKEGKP